MTGEEKEKDRIDRLIEFFKTLRARAPSPKEPDYSRWNQTEEQYQKEQAEWLEQVRKKKKEKKRGGPDADRQGD